MVLRKVESDRVNEIRQNSYYDYSAAYNSNPFTDEKTKDQKQTEKQIVKKAEEMKNNPIDAYLSALFGLINKPQSDYNLKAKVILGFDSALIGGEIAGLSSKEYMDRLNRIYFKSIDDKANEFNKKRYGQEFDLEDYQRLVVKCGSGEELLPQEDRRFTQYTISIFYDTQEYVQKELDTSEFLNPGYKLGTIQRDMYYTVFTADIIQKRQEGQVDLDV